jgi:hypothetical protein
MPKAEVQFNSGVTARGGHVSPETAFVVEDYPYGGGLRCKIRYWLEFKRGQGFRFMSQTTDPRKAENGKPEVWNKPKASTYQSLMVITQAPADEKGIRPIGFDSVSGYNAAEKIDLFVSAYSDVFDDAQQEAADMLKRIAQRDRNYPGFVSSPPVPQA